jgi:uncharacterized membrane protein YfcA
VTFDIPLSELVVLAGVLLAAGVVTGVLAGLLGIGGGSVVVPVLYETFRALGVAEDVCLHLAVGTSLAIMVPTSLRSAALHHARGALDTSFVRGLALPVIAGVCLGAVIARFAGGDALKGVWIACTALISFKLYFGSGWRLGDALPGNPVQALFGLFVGAASVLMSIGGGSFIAAYMTVYGRSILQAVATSSAFGPIISIPGIVGFVWAGWHVDGLPFASIGYVNLLGALVVMPASVLAAPLGVRLAHGIPKRKLELAFATFLALIAVRFLVSLAVSG